MQQTAAPRRVAKQRAGPNPVSRAPPRTHKRRDDEPDERLIWQQPLGDHVTLYSADAGIFPRRPPSGHGRVGSKAGRSWEASRPHLALQQKAPLSLLSNRVGEGGTHPRVDACCSTDVVIRHVGTIPRCRQPDSMAVPNDLMHRQAAKTCLSVCLP